MALRTPSPPRYTLPTNKSQQMQSQPQVVWPQQPQHGSLLHELYSDNDVYQDDQHGHAPYPNDDHASHHLPRRATYPYVRADSTEETVHPSPYPQPYVHEELVNPFARPASSGSSTEGVYSNDSFVSSVKLEEPQQQQQFPPHASLPQHLGMANNNYYRSPYPPPHHHPHHQPPPQQQPQHFSMGSPYHHPHPHPHAHPHHHQQHMNPYHNSLVPGMPLPTSLSPHSGLPIQHTDDAASKETQYLRRRCFNCHTTEPPSWRRSTLNPGKIVCNKCGLYERTHLRPRPLRFDELRAGNKARKAAAAAAAALGPPPTKTSPKLPTNVGKSPLLGGVKKEPSEYPITRRSSVSSVNGGSSDWDDGVSMYSGSSSTSSSAYPSPAQNTYPIPRSSNSPLDPLTSSANTNEIRLPNASLSDLMPDTNSRS